MITTIKIKKKRVTPEVMQHAVACQLLTYFSQFADDDGLLIMNFSEVCRLLHVDYNKAQKELAFLIERGLVCKNPAQKEEEEPAQKEEEETCSDTTTYEASEKKNRKKCGKKTEETAPAVRMEEEKEAERESSLPPAPLSLKEKEEEREEFQTNNHVIENEEISSSRIETEVTAVPIDTEQLDREMEKLYQNQVFLEAFAMREHLTKQQVFDALMHFREECVLQGKLKHVNNKDLQAHFVCWYRKTLKIKSHGNKENQYVTPQERRRADQQQRFAGYAAALSKYN